MTFDLVTALHNPNITIADLERLRDEPHKRPYVGEVSRAIAAAAQDEIDRRRAAHQTNHPKGGQ